MRTLPACLVYVAVAAATLTGCSSAEEGFREGFAAGSAASSTAPTTPPQVAQTAEPVRQIVIPDIAKGQNGAIALETLQRAGLTKVQPASRDKNDRFVVNPANWSVVSVEPRAGTEVSSDSTVVVTMTKQN